MKKYIIFSYNITGMGGGQQYIYNKSKYLESINYEVYIYSAIRGKVFVEGLKKHRKFIIDALKYPPNAFNKRNISRILKRIIQEIGDYNSEIYVESDGGYETLWAELLAQKLRCKHLCLNVAEQQNKFYSSGFLEYMFFKYKRKELYGITKDSLRIMFDGVYDIEDSEKYTFSAHCTNVVDEHNIEYHISIPSADYNICGIWRTNKEGFIETIKNMVPFFDKYYNYKFNVVIIGSGSSENERVAKELLRNCYNVTIIFLGYIYPIPLSLLRRMDVFVSTAGSARIPVYYDIPSIAVTTGINQDGNLKFYPLGILNYTTTNTVVPVETEKKLSDFLDLVLFQKYCDNNPKLGFQNISNVKIEKEFKRQLDLFNTNIDKKYYDVLSIHPESVLEKVYTIIGSLFGVAVLSFLDFCGARIKRHIIKGV